MHNSNIKPQFIPFYTVLGLAAQAGCITPETLLQGQSNYNGDQIWPPLLETMKAYDEAYAHGDILHCFSGHDDDLCFYAEYWRAIYDYLLDQNGNEVMDPNIIKTQQDAINFFLDYASKNKELLEKDYIQYFIYLDPETQIEHLFIFALV